MDQIKDVEKVEDRNETRDEQAIVEEHLTVEIPTEIQAGLRMPPCVYDCDVVVA